MNSAHSFTEGADFPRENRPEKPTVIELMDEVARLKADLKTADDEASCHDEEIFGWEQQCKIDRAAIATLTARNKDLEDALRRLRDHPSNIEAMENARLALEAKP